MNIQKKVAKKAYTEIKKIQTANNMICVERAINDALLNAFGLRNLGLMKYAIDTDNNTLLSQYGYGGKSKNFQLIKAMRYFNLDTYHKEVVRYLITFIPERLNKSEMYKRIIERN